MLSVLWLVQVSYLETFYKLITTQNAVAVKSEAIELLFEEKEGIEEKLDLLAAKNNFAIFVTDSNGEPIYNAEYIANSRLNTLPKESFDRYYQEAKENNGSAKITFKGADREFFSKDIKRDKYDDKMPPGEEPRDDKYPPRIPKAEFMQNHGLDGAESVIYIEILQLDGEECVFFLNCILTPVDATVRTLKVELIVISVYMVFLALIIALVISRHISKSIICVSDSAKELAKGNFDVEFTGKDYKEIALLSDTLNYTAAELEKTEKLRRELIANVSHDLRTPLTMISAYAQAMQDLPGENTPENIQVVIDEAERLTNLVNSMLDLSKLQAGVLEKNESCFDITNLINSVLARYNKLVEQNGYRIEFEYDASIWVLGDEYKLCQVLYNLINNAVNYAGIDKTIIVRQIRKDSIVRIEVEDHGDGIENENIPYVWDRYYKVDKTHKRAVMGTGLGLSIVKNILELHSASFGVESEPGKGSVFWFELEEIEEPSQ